MEECGSGSAQPENDAVLDNPETMYQRLLEQHIERKINAAIRRNFGETNPAMDQGLENAESRRSVLVKGNIIPDFDPDQNSMTVTSWLQKIEQLGRIHHWSEYEKSCYMQNQLKGAARDWFNRLEEYDKTWEEWKTALSNAFPRCSDFATILEELVARHKRPDETMTHYYHAKMGLAQQCRLDDAAIISCVIKGLPLELQANARAFQCKAPDELYAGFIAPMENYQSPYSPKKPRLDEPSTSQFNHRHASHSSRSLRCFTCGKGGHISRDCYRRMPRCFKCNKRGHISSECVVKRDIGSNREKPKDVKLIDSAKIPNLYKKLCKVNGVDVLGYLDTGSEVSVITKDITEKLGLKTFAKENFLKGFGGQQVRHATEALF